MRYYAHYEITFITIFGLSNGVCFDAEFRNQTQAPAKGDWALIPKAGPDGNLVWVCARGAAGLESRIVDSSPGPDNFDETEAISHGGNSPTDTFTHVWAEVTVTGFNSTSETKKKVDELVKILCVPGIIRICAG